MKCNNECTTCNTLCETSCPVCHMKAKKVNIEASKNMLKDPSFLLDDKTTYICNNRKCEVTYFQADNPVVYLKEDLVKPIWFKEALPNQIICYCYNIYFKDIIKIVNETDAPLTIEDVKSRFVKIKDASCDTHNPIGESCEVLFKNALEFAYHKKERKE